MTMVRPGACITCQTKYAYSIWRETLLENLAGIDVVMLWHTWPVCRSPCSSASVLQSTFALSCAAAVLSPTSARSLLTAASIPGKAVCLSEKRFANLHENPAEICDRTMCVNQIMAGSAVLGNLVLAGSAISGSVKPTASVSSVSEFLDQKATLACGAAI